MTSDRGRLAGKAALITGASSGIGRAMVELFAAEGARVAAIGRSPAGLEAVAELDNVVAIKADITRANDVDRMIGEAEARFGGLDIVCNVAGINDLAYPLDETSDERWDDVLDLDLKAPFRICRRAIGGMIARGGGVILNIGSYAAVRGNHGPSYTAAKAGLTGLTRSIAVGFASKGIRCNVLNPGAVDTDIKAHSGGDYHPRGLAMFRDIAGKLPVKWKCEPVEIARAALLLCSDDARHINGAEIAVDGGMSAC